MHPNPPAGAPNHASLLNAAEKRLISEWMDLGGQYLNDPSQSAERAQRRRAEPQRPSRPACCRCCTSTCVACHQPVGNSGAAQGTTSFVRNRFVLTGNPRVTTT